MSNRQLLKHLQACDSWMRELCGWLWHRRDNSCVKRDFDLLAKDIKRGEKILAKLKGSGK